MNRRLFSLTGGLGGQSTIPDDLAAVSADRLAYLCDNVFRWLDREQADANLIESYYALKAEMESRTRSKG